MTANRPQNYNNNLKDNDFCIVNGYLLAKINREMLKAMSKVGLNVSDWRYVPLIEEYVNMVGLGMKREHIRAVLADKYDISVSSVKRIVRRMLKQVRI